MTVELFSRFLSQLGHHVAAVGVEQVHEALENVQVEGGCDQLTVGTPLLAGRDQQSVAKPRLEEPVLGTLVNVDAASKDQLNKTTKSPCHYHGDFLLLCSEKENYFSSEIIKPNN